MMKKQMWIFAFSALALSACGKKESQLCGTLVSTEGIASRLTAAGIRRYDEMEADGEPPQRCCQ